MTATAGVTDPRPREPTICVAASEASGDRLGAALMRALVSAHGPLRIVGIGDREMLQEGLQPLVPMQHFAVIGFSLLKQVPAILRYIRDVADAVVAAKPDALVIIDSPELTHRIARRVRQRAPSIPIVDYVSPSVWAWRPGRARAMRAYVDHVLALLPFEPQVHVRLGGPVCSYVGHPLIEQLGDLRPNTDEAVRRRSDPPVVLVLPGSRPGEIRRMTGVFGHAIAQVEQQFGALEIVIPTVPQLRTSLEAATAHWTIRPQVVVDARDKWAAFRIARAALTKSGTVTLELALAGIPMVAAYRVSPFDALIARMAINVPSVILANLILEENVVPEFLQGDCRPATLAAALLPLLEDTPQRRRQLEAFARLDTVMEIGNTAPSARAAEIVLRHAKLG